MLMQIFKLLLAVFLLAAFTPTVRAVAPPQEGDLEKYRQDGSLPARIELNQQLRNDHFHPGLLNRAGAKLRQLELLNEGKSPDEVVKLAPLPPPAWRGMPTTGTNKTLTLLIEFQDTQHTPVNSTEFIHNSIYGDGVANSRPYESLSKYYKRSSYGKLTITGNTIGWYSTPYPRNQVAQTPAGRESLIKEALLDLEKRGHDFSQYDNDGNGSIDYLMVIYAGRDTGWGSFWWAYQTDWKDLNFRVGGKSLSTYVFQFQNFEKDAAFSPEVIIHETGHALGLPDYYDYKPTVGPKGGLGGLDMMDKNRGDHNCFSKWMLEWIVPRIIGAGSVFLELRPSGSYSDAVLVMPNAVNNPFREYFMVQNRTHAGNDDAANWPGDGLMIWHIDGRLDPNGNNFLFDNHTTDHKLIRLMEADGKEQIETGRYAGDAGDFFGVGSVLGPTTMPNSKNYSGNSTGVFVKDIKRSQSGISAIIGIESLHPSPTFYIKNDFMKLGP